MFLSRFPSRCFLNAHNSCEIKWVEGSPYIYEILRIRRFLPSAKPHGPHAVFGVRDEEAIASRSKKIIKFCFPDFEFAIY